MSFKKYNKNTTKNSLAKTIDTFNSPSIGNVEVVQFDNGNRFFRVDNRTLKTNDLIRLLVNLDSDKLKNNLVKLNSYLQAVDLFYSKKVLDNEDGKTYTMKHFENLVKKQQGVSTITKEDLLLVINDKKLDFILVDELGSQTKKSSFDKIAKKVENNVINNTFEGTNNISESGMGTISGDQIIKDMGLNNTRVLKGSEIELFKAWYEVNNNKGLAFKKYGIKRNFNTSYNKSSSKALIKYVNCYDNEVSQYSGNNIPNNNLFITFYFN